MPKTWDQMTADEKLDRLRYILEDFVDHYNQEVINRNNVLNSIGDRLKKIEEALGQK